MLNDYFLKGKINVFRKKYLYYAAGTFGAAPFKKKISKNDFPKSHLFRTLEQVLCNAYL